MRRDGDLVTRVLAAKRDPRCADDLVRDYLPFIKAETAKFMGRSPQQGRDDELGIAMFAFHEAVLSYDRARGAFLSFAALNVRNRLVDCSRRERRHADVLSLDERRPDGGEGDERSLVEMIASERDELEERQTREASRQEIVQFGAELESFGLTFLDVSENCPKQQRTLEACQRVLDCARRNPELLDRLVQDGAVDAQSAQPVQALFASYAQYRADTAGMAELPAFTIHSEYPGGAAFLRSADGAEVLTLQTQETMSFDRSAGTMQADRVLTLSAPGVAEETVLAGTALSDGVLRRSLNGSQSEQAVTAIAQARLLSCYGPAPLACIASLTQEAADGRWTITFDGLPSLYRELLWPVESTVGSLDGAAIHAVTLQQEVEDGRIVCQRLAADFTSADGICGQPELVSTLEVED